MAQSRTTVVDKRAFPWCLCRRTTCFHFSKGLSPFWFWFSNSIHCWPFLLSNEQSRQGLLHFLAYSPFILSQGTLYHVLQQSEQSLWRSGWNNRDVSRWRPRKPTRTPFATHCLWWRRCHSQSVCRKQQFFTSNSTTSSFSCTTRHSRHVFTRQ